MSLKKVVASNSRRHPYGPDFDALGRMSPHVELPQGIFTVSEFRGATLDRILDDSRLEEVHTNDALDEFGISNGDRQILLTSYNGDSRYGARFVRAAAKLTREMGFRGDYGTTSLNWQHAFISLTRFIRNNDEDAARLFLEYTGLLSIDEAAKKIRGYTAIEMEDGSALVPKKSVASLLKSGVRGVERSYFEGLMEANGLTEQACHGVPIYLKLKKVTIN